MVRRATRPDGRHARKARTREAIVEAVLALLDEGHVEPTAAQIAARAEVAVRSIGQHFRSREQLLLAVAAHHAARQPRPARVSPSESFETRLNRFVAERAAELEASRAVRRAAVRGAATSHAVAAGLAAVGVRRRKELTAALGKELQRAGSPARAASEALSSGACWDALRSDQRLSLSAAKQSLAAGLRGLLDR